MPPNDFTERDIGYGKTPRHEIYIEDILEAAYSPNALFGANAGAAAVEALVTVPTGYYAVVTHVVIRRAAVNNDIVHIEVVQRGDTGGVTGKIVGVENLFPYTTAAPADAVSGFAGSLIFFPIVLDEEEVLDCVSGGAQAAGAVVARYVLIPKRGKQE